MSEEESDMLDAVLRAYRLVGPGTAIEVKKMHGRTPQVSVVHREVRLASKVSHPV